MPRVSVVVMAVPMVRNHPPPKVLPRWGTQSGGLQRRVSSRFLVSLFWKVFWGGVRFGGASSGYDAIPIHFLMYASLPVQNDGRVRSVDVSVPLMALKSDVEQSYSV